MEIRNIDLVLIRYAKKIIMPMARFALFLVFFWFGILKVIGHSPATPLVQSLFESMMPIIPFSLFIILFGFLEMLIGILFLIPKAERIVIPIMFFHMVTTIMPLFLLPEITWSGFMVPTIEGQYIIKNILIIALGIVVAAHIKPFSSGHKHENKKIEK